MALREQSGVTYGAGAGQSGVPGGAAYLQMSSTVQNDSAGLAVDIFTQLSDRDMASELLAVVAQRPDDLARIPLTEELLVLLLDRPHSPGNLGSTIRSADQRR